MTTAPSNPKPRRTSPPLSVLAVIAMVLAVVPCCPLVSLLGGVLGLLAMRRIQLAAGRLRGLKLARIAAITGFAVTVAASVLLSYLSSEQERSMRLEITRVVDSVMKDAAAGDLAKAEAQWVGMKSAEPLRPRLAAFAQTCAQRYGAYDRFSITLVNVGGNLMSPQGEAPGVFMFEKASLTGSVEFVMVPGTGAYGIFPGYRVKRIVIEDEQLGDLALSATGKAAPSP